MLLIVTQLTTLITIVDNYKYVISWILIIVVVFCDSCALEWRCPQNVIKFSNLKVLSIHLDSVPAQLLHRFDFSSCSDSLKKLSLLETTASRMLPKDYEHKKLIVKFVESIKSLKNLKCLTIDVKNMSIDMNFIRQLKSLR